jgi:hypothetical protein
MNITYTVKFYSMSYSQSYIRIGEALVHGVLE